VDLSEECHLANAAPAALEVGAGSEARAAAMMGANAAGDRLDFADRPEIDAAAPDEGVDGFEEIAAQRRVSRREAGADEGRPLPGQSGGFVVGDGRVDRQGDRRDLARGAKAQVNPEGEALRLPGLKQRDDPLPDADRGLTRLLAGTAGQRRGVEQEDRVDVGRIIELAAAMLAERDD